jgi:hypothetical protein
MSLGSSTKREFTSLEIFRPISGADEFLAKVGHFALNIFGITNEAIVTQPSEEVFEDDSRTVLLEDVIGVGFPRVKVARPDELKVTILERMIPKEMNFAGAFRLAATKLVEKGEKVALPVRKDGDETVKYRTSSLYESLDNIGHKYDIFDQNNVEIVCNGIQTDLSVENTLGTVLSLTFNPAKKSTQMLIEQSQRCLRGLAENSTKAAYPTSRMPISIPFATLPVDSTERQAEEFLNHVSGTLPIKLVMGGIESQIQF